MDLGFVLFRKKRENNSDTHIYKTPSHFSGKRFRGKPLQAKVGNGKLNIIFLCVLFGFRFTVYNEEHIFLMDIHVRFQK